jgi:tetratricopeptide (TPR) repeat protein
VALLAKDIRHIKLNDVELKQHDEFFFGSTYYWIVLVSLFGIFVVLLSVFRQRAIENADLVKSRGKRANKVATKRLRKANQLMKANQSSQFYDEVLRALWGYVGDKLNIPVDQLSHDNISSRLMERNVDESTINDFIGAIDECEFERYAPGDTKGNMSKVYEKAMTAIEHIEDAMKKKSKNNIRTFGILLIVLLSLSLQTAQATTKTQADSAYVQGNYQQAIILYEEILKSGQSAEIYYNLGNAYYRQDDITHAVLNYERALMLSPGDGDIRFNLQMAQSKTIDKIIPESEMFFVTWYHSLTNLSSVDGWARMALVALTLAIVLALVYLFSNPVWLRKVGFFCALAMLVFFVLGNLFAWQQKQELTNRRGAIIMKGAVPVKSTPAKDGTDLFILHEGTKVNVTDNSMREWKEIRVPDGKQGWIETNQIEII